MKKTLIIGAIASLALFGLIQNQAFGKKINNPHQVYKAYFEDGTLKYTYHYYNGLPHGTNKEYYANGQIYTEIQYYNGKLHGDQYRWASDGSPVLYVKWIDGVEITRLDYPIKDGVKTSPKWKPDEC